MEAILIILLLYILVYCAYISALSYGFKKVEKFESAVALTETTFSILVPFRNEDQNLPRLLDSLAELNYPKDKFELIFIDDFSEDFSVNLINKWRMQNGRFQTTLLENLRLTKSPKKDAITRAMPIVANQWVITTDADCKVPSDWLQLYNAFIIQNSVEMIVAPVVYDGKQSFRHYFERVDMLSLQATTIGGFGLGKPFMCNGANFGYSAKLFNELGGFSGNDTVASGDDVFLLQKAAKANKKIGYLKSADAVVITQPTDSWLQLIQQRVRWASKSTSYQDFFATDLALVVLLGNAAIVASVLLAAIGYCEWQFVLGFFILKCISDFILIAQGNALLQKRSFSMPLFAALFYPFFCTLVGIFALSGKYRWKGRTYRK